MKNIRKSFLSKAICVFLAQAILFQVIFPFGAMALTGGPSAPNFGTFSQVGTSDMVDLTSGDLKYKLDLMSVGDMPLSISYAGGASTADDGGVCGINWSPSWGGVTKTMRGLSDDMNGEKVRKKFYKKKNWTVRANFSPEIEPFTIELSKDADSKLGKFSKWLNDNSANLKSVTDSSGKKTGEKEKGGAGAIDANFGIAFNNYTGFELSASVSPAVNLACANGLGGSAGISAGVSSQSGASVTPTLNFSYQSKKAKNNDLSFTSGINIGLPYNSRAGLQAFTFGVDIGAVKVNPDKSRKDQMLFKSPVYSFGEPAEYSFSSPSYIPSYENSMNNMNASFTLKLGGSAFGVFANGSATGTFDMQWIPVDEYKDNGKEMLAYGFMYAHKASGGDCLMDFNREKDGFEINENIKNIGLAQETYDLFNVSAPGIGGSFRTTRSDVGIVKDANAKSGGGGGGVSGFDLGPGNIIDNGLNLKANWANSKSGGWSDSYNKLTTDFGYKSNGTFKRYEPFYFRQAGEFVVESDPNILANLGGENASRFDLVNGKGYANSTIKPNLGQGELGDVRRRERERRNVVFQALKANHAQYVALDKKLKFYERYSNGTYSEEKEEERIQSATNDFYGKYKKDHISEIKVIGADGKTYYFGLPSYVTKHEEVTYQTDASGKGDACKSGIVAYKNSENKPNNNVKEEYFQSTELPPYTNAFMLTAIVSSDFIDKKGDGLDFDSDHGNGTKIKYFRQSTNYGWRTPYNGVNFNEGLKSQVTDNKASYVYGEKELWYVREVESRTSIAIFHYDEREDACGAKRSGGIDVSQKQLKLIKISLYAKPEYEKYGNDAVPIKEAHFKYNYRGFLGNQKLPSNTGVSPDASGFVNEGGKLMLEQVYFTYGKSKKGKVSPYIFHYDENPNVSFAEKSADGWGVFKADLGTNCDPNAMASNIEDPHTKQSNITDEYASAYSLKRIETPSGGTIEITLKSDRYAYVQDKRAMNMYTITGVGSDAHTTDIYNEELYGSASSRRYVYFKLQDVIGNEGQSEQELKAQIKEKYFLKDDGNMMEYLFFKSLVEVSGSPGSLYQDVHEYIQGYAGIDDFGVNMSMTNEHGDYTYGYILLKSEKISEAYGWNINPIAKAGWEFTRMYLPHIAYNKPPKMGEGTGLQHIVGQLSSVYNTVLDMVLGFNLKMFLNGNSKKLKPQKTFIKMMDSRMAKYGGGHRVEKLVIKDNWKIISGSSNYQEAEYGQEYDYTMEQDGKIISSGVAQAEPIIIQDASPYKYPDGKINEVKNYLAPNDKIYQEGPFGQSFMPSASVAYRKITVKNIQHDNVKTNATGWVEHYNYTAYEFPIKLRKTGLDVSMFSPKKNGKAFLKSLLGLTTNSLEASQGFYIETNNMHGIKKGEKIFNESGDQISAVTYEYKRKQVKDATGKLVPTCDLINEVQTLGKDGVIRTENIGLEVEAVVDSKWSETVSNSVGMNLNMNTFTITPIPAFLLSIIPKYTNSKSAYKTVSFTKVVNRLGVLEKVVAEDLGSVVETKNVLYDRESGQVILTETQNQFDAPVYNFTYLAGWVYRQMGPAYYNAGMEMLSTSTSELKGDDFIVGDELVLNVGSVLVPSWGKYWVTKSVIGGAVEIQNSKGTIYSGNISFLKVIRSGARNKHTTPVGSITSLKSPIVNGEFALKNTGSANFKAFYASILNASAIEFSNDWKTWCNCEYADYEEWNIFQNARLAGWRPKRSYVYLTNRKQSLANENTNIREDGAFVDFAPFWLHSNGDIWVPTTSDKWTWVETIISFSPLGQELERMNALGIYSATVFGYNRLLPTGVAGNAKYSDIGEDNFEDVEFSNCDDDHFSYKEYKTQNTTSKAHTGRRSLFVPQKSSVKLTKIIEECSEK